MAATMSTTLKKQLKEQDDEQYLREVALPALKAVRYQGPTVATHGAGPRENHYVITNDAHTKSTNNGFKRNDKGGFFCH